MEIVDFPHCRRICNDTPVADWANRVIPIVQQNLNEKPHGDIPRWRKHLDALPEISPDQIALDRDAITAGSSLNPELSTLIRQQLLGLSPWRKGPFDLHGVYIDSEWRSNMKWQRLQGQLDLDGHHVLDIGCGNGYYLWRMLGHGAHCAIGVDPGRLFSVQFQAVRKMLGMHFPACILPAGIEHIPFMPVFDTVFSMGVIYHRRNPQEHLQQLIKLLRPGGQLVLESLIITSEAHQVLEPPGRYAQMRNVRKIPSPSALLKWVENAGFESGRILDITPTTIEEQRPTEWMQFQSLPDFLDSSNPAITVEGHPAPVRAIVIANKS